MNDNQHTHIKGVVFPPREQKPRKVRKDRGRVLLNDRDVATLDWIIEQYAVRFDHLQLLLGRQPGPRVLSPGLVGESATRQVINRWERTASVETEKARAKEPIWVWVTARYMRERGVTYKPYRPSDFLRSHLHAINVVRLDIEAAFPDYMWVSERCLRAGLVHEKNHDLQHIPDGEIHRPDGDVIAVEVELSPKRTDELRKILLELVKGNSNVPFTVLTESSLQENKVTDLRVFGSTGEIKARTDVRKASRTGGNYAGVWYYAPKAVIKQVVQVRTSLLTEGELNAEEAGSICVYSYPPVPDEEPQ